MRFVSAFDNDSEGRRLARLAISVFGYKGSDCATVVTLVDNISRAQTQWTSRHTLCARSDMLSKEFMRLLLPKERHLLASIKVQRSRYLPAPESPTIPILRFAG